MRAVLAHYFTDELRNVGNILKSMYLFFFFVAHWLLSLSAYLVLYGLGLALQEAGSASALLAWLELPLRFVLLQPLAHWLLDTAAAASWTWAGLAETALLVALNSAVVSLLLAGIVAALRSWRSRRREARI